MAQSVSIEEDSEALIATDSGLGPDQALPRDTVVYSIDGPRFFGAAEILEKTPRRSQNACAPSSFARAVFRSWIPP